MADEKQGFDSGIHQVLAQLDLQLTQSQINALFAHYTLLKKWNQRMNLTGIRTLQEVIWRHFGESLAVAKAVGPGTGKVVDVGSGGGFPGLPLAVCWPRRPVVLLESVEKKAVFLQEASRMEHNLTVRAGRFEDFNEQVEWVVVRAVALDEIWGQVAKVAGRAALLVSRDQLEDGKGRFGAGTVVARVIPWSPAAYVVSGEVVRST